MLEQPILSLKASDFTHIHNLNARIFRAFVTERGDQDVFQDENVFKNVSSTSKNRT